MDKPKSTGRHLQKWQLFDGKEPGLLAFQSETNSLVDKDWLTTVEDETCTFRPLSISKGRARQFDFPVLNISPIPPLRNK